MSDMKIQRLAASAVVAVLLTAGPAMAEMDGEKLFEYHGCVTCHGAEAKDPASKIIPVLAGEPEEELFEKARKILSGKGATKESQIMHAAFHSPDQCDHPPTDAELTAITTYIASVPGP
jgi:cytochrome c553